jgi:hypothetical protein
MKSKDQTLLEEAYNKVQENSGARTMTPEQEKTYNELSKIGFEFDYWDGKDVVMTKRDRGMEYSSVVASKAILPTGETFPMDIVNDPEYQGEDSE